MGQTSRLPAPITIHPCTGVGLGGRRGTRLHELIAGSGPWDAAPRFPAQRLFLVRGDGDKELSPFFCRVACQSRWGCSMLINDGHVSWNGHYDREGLPGRNE